MRYSVFIELYHLVESTSEFRKLGESDNCFYPVLRNLACLEKELEKFGLEMVSKTEYLD